LIRTDVLEGAAAAPSIGPAPPSEREVLEAELESKFGNLVDNDGQPIHRFLSSRRCRRRCRRTSSAMRQWRWARRLR
jgi:hypothetical protein